MAQLSDNPSDATPGLAFTTSAGISTPLPSACGPSGSINPASLHFSLSGSTTTATTLVAPPVCGNYLDLPPAAPNAANDVWFRLDAPAAATRFRFTLLNTGVSAPAMTDGAVAVYEAASAAGPFRLIECAVGGSLTTTLPSVEVNNYTPGNKLYLRVWDESTRTSAVNFTICVQGQTTASMLGRGAAETACTATTINSSITTNIDYVFANEESAWLQSDSAYVGGDLWLSLTIPASGSVRMTVARGTTPSATAQTIGISAYLTSNCSDATKYRQVGAFTTALPTTTPAAPNWQIACLPAGEILYLRIHSLKSAQATQKRYGRFRLTWLPGAAPPNPTPTNNQPCGATPLAFNVSCPVTPGTGGNFDACNTPGIPLPSCGGFDGSSRDVWYSFVAPLSGTVFIEASPGTSVPADPAIALYTTGGNGCNGRFTLIECDAQQGEGTGARIIRNGLVGGQTYYVRAWAEGADAQGSFSLCVSEPTLPAGSCFYLISLSAEYPPGTQFMDVTINGGTPVTYATTGDPNEIFVIAIPTGASVFFEYYNSGTSLSCTREIYRLGDPTPLWSATSGGPVIGPAPLPQFTFTLNNACAPLTSPRSDCLGSETVCTPNTEFGTIQGSLVPGNNYDLTATNMGCLSTESTGIAWLIFHPTQSGTVAFWFDGTTIAPTTDLDFAIWDAGLIDYDPVAPNINSDICAPSGPPVRCSSARRNYSTGLFPGVEGVYQEGPGGWGWLSPLSVVADHVYLVALVRGASSLANVQYQMRWTMYTNSSGTPNSTMLDCTNLVLPVELLFLQAAPQGRTVDVTWATATERNSRHFIVERSIDAVNFSPIGEVGASGDTQQRRDYTFTDTDPVKGTNYYRLQQVDRDGTAVHTYIVTAFIDGEDGSTLVYPNPVKDRLQAAFTMPAAGRAEIHLLDALGRSVRVTTVASEQGRHIAELDMQDLVPGAYILHIMTPDGELITNARFIKE